MTPFRRALIVWAALMALFLGAVVAANYFGGRMVGRVNAHARLGEAQELFDKRRYSDAVSLLRDTLELGPENRAVRLLLVRCLYRSGLLDAAFEEGQALLERTREREEREGVLLLLAHIARAKAAWEEARDYTRQALEAAPDEAEAHAAAAELAFLLEEYEEMVSHLKRVAELGGAGTSGEFQSLRAEQLVLERALRSNAAKEPAGWNRYRLGAVLKELGRWDEAVAAFSAAAEEVSAPADTFFWLGVDAEARGDKVAAVAFYQQALERLPEHVRARRALERLH